MISAGGEPLLIIGASARAAAESARHAGYRPYAIDLFADADLADIAEVRRSRKFPHDLPTLARTMPACDWLYVGGLENYPEVVDAIAAERQLLGTAGEVLRRVRDPQLFGRAMCMQGVSFPESIFDPAEFRRLIDADPSSVSRAGERPSTGEGSEWLVKHRRSSAGLGVAVLRQHDMSGRRDEPFDDGRYLQCRVAGTSMGAVFLATKQATYLLGITQQLTCPFQDGSHPFRYAGSLGPLPSSRPETQRLLDKLEKIGSLATRVFPVSGIFSLDFLLDAGGLIRPLEINPRYTASVELLERSYGRSLIALHIAACRGAAVETLQSPIVPLRTLSQTVHGKRIVYAPGSIGPVPAGVTAELLRRRREAERLGHHASVADIPPAGSKIAAEEPIATVFASGSDENDVQARLTERAHKVREIFRPFSEAS